MRNLFKKSLACCLALALCLTAMVGLTVSAAEVAGTITVGEVTVEPGTAEAKVDITLSAAGLSEAILNVSTDAGTITAVTSDDVSATLATNGIKMALYTEGDSSVDSATATITVALADTQTEKEYTVNVSIATAASVDENLINAEPASGKISVKAAVVESSFATIDLYDMSYAEILKTVECDDIATALTSASDYANGVVDGEFYNPVINLNKDCTLDSDLYVPEFVVLNLGDAVLTYGDYSIYITGEYSEVRANYDITSFDGNPFVKESNAGGVYTYVANTVYSITGASLTLGDQIFVNYTASSLKAAVKDDVTYGFVYYKTSAAEEIYDVVAENATSSSFKIQTIGIPAKEMKIDFVAKCYVEKVVDGVTYRAYSGELGYNVVDYCSAVISDTKGTFTDDFKALAKALLNYGSYAQVAFDFYVDDLANSILDEADKALPADFESEFSTKYFIKSKALENDLFNTIMDNGTIGTGYNSGTQNLVLLDSVDYQFKMADRVEANTYKLYVWTYSEYKALAEQYGDDLFGLSAAMTPENCSNVVDIEGDNIKIPAIAAKNLADTLVTRVIEITPSGDMYFDALVSCSPINYANELLSATSATEEFKDLCKYLAVYSEKARVFFGNTVD